MGDSVKVSVLPKCDIKKEHGDAEVDGATTFGPWANMCGACFDNFGVGLGTGKGQRLELAP